jgi:hypothetical protein
MNTERNWLNENRYYDSEETAPGGVVPAWSVPPGLLDPDRRAVPPVDDPEPERVQASVRDNWDEPWTGPAQPARWFLRAPAGARTQGVWQPPAPHREPDGSWSSTPPAPPTAPRPAVPAPRTPEEPQASGEPQEPQEAADGLSPWQRSQRQWQEAGIGWSPVNAGNQGASPTRPDPVMPLSAPVMSEPRETWHDLEEPEDEEFWADERPPIWERPAGLFPRARSRMGDSLLLDPDRPRRSPMGAGAWPALVSRRTATLAIPAVVLLSVAVLALALLMGHGPKFGELTGNRQGGQTPKPQSPLVTAALATYPGQQQRGVFQVINRVISSGRTVVTIGSQTSDGVVRQQFFVSTDGGASWRLAPVRGPGGGQAPMGYPAALLAGGPGGWLAVSPQATWTSPDGTSWALAQTHGIAPQLPGDGVWVITRTAQGYLAAGAGGGQAVVWTSRDGLTWQRMTAAQLGLAGPGETVQNISFASYHGGATVISGQVRGSGGSGAPGTSYSGTWLSTNGGSSWTRVMIPADHGAGAQLSGLGFDADGLIAVRAGQSANGTADGVAYFSQNGQVWQYAGTIDPTGGWTPAVVKGSDDGFVATGTTSAGTIVGYTSTGTGGTWQPTAPLGSASAESVTGVTVTSGGTVIAVGSASGSKLSQQPVFVAADTTGNVRPVLLAGVPGALVPERAVNGLAVSGGQMVAVGSANGYPAIWRKAAGGNWSLVTPLSLASAYPGLRALTGVTHGPAGWLAVGAPGPVILTSADGINWQRAGGNITQDLDGVAAVATASGPVGYIIVGKLVAAGGGCIADVWWSPNLLIWTRAHDVNLATGSSQVLAVAADAGGFVSVGSHNGKPAVWTTTDGSSWRTILLPVPAGAASGVLQEIAISGHRVAALGQGIAANGATTPLAEFSADGGTTWRQVPFAASGSQTAFTALTVAPAGFTAAGLSGPPGQQQVAVWTSADGTGWSQVGTTAAAGTSEITALARSGGTVTGIGPVITQPDQQIVTLPLP